MNKRKEDVQALVQSLNKEEKRHFTLLFGHKGGTDAPPLFYQLYSIYEKDDITFSKENIAPSIRAFAGTKQRLYENLLRTLRDLNSDSSTNILVQNKLTNVELLYNHSLPEQSVLELNKAYYEARKFEKFGLMLQLLDWEKRLNIVLSEPTRPLSEIKKEEREILKKFAQQMDLESIFNHIVEVKRKLGFAWGNDKKKLERATVKNPGMPKESECLSNNAKFYHHYIYAIYHFMTFNHKEAYKHSQQLLEFDLLNIQPDDYVTGVFQHITSSVCLAKFTDTLNGITLAEALMEQYRLNQSVPFANRMFGYHANYKMIVLSYMGRYNELDIFVKQVEQRIKDSGKTISLDILQIILANLMVSYVALDMPDMVAFTRKRLLDMKKKTELRLDIHTSTYFFQLFFLMHTGVYDLIKSAARSALHFFRKHPDSGNVLSVEIPIALLLSKEHNYEDPKVRAAIMHKCRKIVTDFISKLKGSINFQEHYSRYLIWFDSIEEGVAFHMAARKWYEVFEMGQRE